MADINVYEIPSLANAMAYEDMKEELKQEHWGKWVVIDDLKLFGVYESFDEAKEATKEAGLNFLDSCIARVGARAAIIL
jgi:hypothetical protein